MEKVFGVSNWLNLWLKFFNFTLNGYCSSWRGSLDFEGRLTVNVESNEDAEAERDFPWHE